MGDYTKIPQSTFQELQVDAGILLSSFNPASPSVSDANIITATTGGITVTCEPTISDWGADVDNVPDRMKEFSHVDGWNCALGFTAINITEDTLKLAIGACAKSSGAIKPDAPGMVDSTRFRDEIWWVGDLSDGGFAAVKVKNALSTGGLSLKTTKNGKGQLSCTLTGHVSISSQTDMPMEFYVIGGDGQATVTQTLTHMYSSFTDTKTKKGAAFMATLTEAVGYSADSVTVTMGGTDITSTAYTSSTGVVSIANVTGNIVITATATAES